MLKYVLTVLALCIGFLISCTASPTPIPTEIPTIAPVERATAAVQERATAAVQERPTAVETSTGRDAPLDPDVLTIYHKSGGFAGIDETLTIHQGGLVELTSRDSPDVKSVQLDEPMLQPLRRMFESQEFANLEPIYRASGADLFTYTITARDINGNMKTVIAMDGASYPDVLGLIISMLNQIRGQIK